MELYFAGVSVFGYDFKAIYGKEEEHFNDYYKIVNFPFKVPNLIRAVVCISSDDIQGLYWPLLQLAKVFGLPTIGDLNSACIRMRDFCKNIILVRTELY